MTTLLSTRPKTREIRPQPKQEMFLSTPADIAIFGGAAGGGKTYGLLLEPLRHISNPRFGAVIFRTTYPQIAREGGLWDESGELYPLLGALANESDMVWRFPSGAKISFSHMHYARDVEGWKGAQIPLIMFDQLEEHAERVFFYMLSRNRSTCGVRPYMRATVNPDPDSWVARFVEWWIDQDTGLPIEARAGHIRWFARNGQEWLWADTRAELLAEHPELEPDQPKSVTFIPAKLEDNPILTERDPGYRANLLAQDYVDQQRLLHGNWKVRATAGKVFNRGWFEIVDAAPAGGEFSDGWDLAATEKKSAGDDPDYTANVFSKLVHGTLYILDAQQMRVGPAEVNRVMLNTTIQHAQHAQSEAGTYRVRWEREPGASGKRDNLTLVRLMSGYDARGVRPQGDKITRLKPLAAQTLAGNVKLVAGPWNEMFLKHMHALPDGDHDDLGDAAEVSTRPLMRAGQLAETQEDEQDASQAA